MSNIDFQNGFAFGLASGGAVKIDNTKGEQEKIIDITENGTTEVLPDENKVLSKVTVNVNVSASGGAEELETLIDNSGMLDSTEGSVSEKVEKLIDLVEENTLPDWDDDSPIIASGKGLTLKNICNCVWELTEKGTLRWKILDKNLTSNHYYTTAGWASPALSAISLDYQAIAPKIKQAYFEDGFTQNELCYAINCKRVRFSNTLTKRPTIAMLTSLDELDVSGELWATLSDYIFNYFIGLKKVILNPLVNTIPRNAFTNCYSLKEINLENITTFGQACFQECFSLDKDIVFNENLLSIAATAFHRTRIKSVKFKNSVDSLPTIANNAFSQCRDLKAIYCPWEEGAVDNVNGGASNVTMYYNVTYDENDNPIDENGNPIIMEV